MTWISETEVKKAVDWMRDHADKIGEAREALTLAESMKKVVLALEMKRSDEKSAAAQERDALASEAYLKAITDEAVKAGEYEKMRALKDAANAKFEAWRTITSLQKSLMK